MSHRRLQQLIAGFSVCSLFLSYIPPTLAQELSEPSIEPIVISDPTQEPSAPVVSDPAPEITPPDPLPETSENPIIEEPTLPEPEPVIPDAPNPNEEKSVDLELDSAKEETESEEPEEEMMMMDSGAAPAKNEAFDNRKLSLPEVEKNNGALVYGYPIITPPGRNGLQPEVKLVYNSQDMQEGGILGSNWSVNIPFIERLNKRGVDQLYSTTTIPVYFNSSLDGELATTTNAGIYSARIENGSFNSYVFSTTTNAWVMTDKNGTRYTFGTSTAARQDDPNDSMRVFKWMLSEVRDTNDNYIKYIYEKDSGQIYPFAIIYTGNGTTDGISQIDFSREGRLDVATSSRTGFNVLGKNRINQIQVKISGTLVRQYALGYTTGDNGTRSLLSTLVESGKDELGNTITVPTTTFSYQVQSPGWSSDASWSPPVTLTESNHHDKGFKIIDANGDSLPDLTWSYDFTPSGYTALINDASGWTQDDDWNPPVTYVSQAFEDKGYKALDVNGDGLPDIIRGVDAPGGGSATYEAYINDGFGWSASSTWNPPVTFTESNYHNKGYKIQDVNGDSLPDLIWSYDFTPSGYSAYINNGHGWTQDSAWNPPVTFVNSLYEDKGYKVSDVDADGLPDIILGVDPPGGGSATYEAYINNGKVQSLLTKVTYPQGGNASFDYKPVAKYATGGGAVANQVPSIIQTVSTVVTNDGFGNVATTTYQYEGGKYYFHNPFDKKFAGFGTVVETDPQGNVSKMYLHQGDSSDSTHGEYSDDFYKIGKPYRTEKYDNAGNLYAKTINRWETNVSGNSGFVKLTQQVESEYNGDASHKDRGETYAYDNATGNQTQKIEFGEVTGSDDGTFSDTGTDKLITDLTYASGATSTVRGAVKQVTVTDQGANKVRESLLYYDGLAHGSINKGNLTKREDWKTSSTYVNTQKAYNAFGLVKSETDARGKVTNYGYDSFNLYPATSTNPLSQLSQYAYDYSLGKPKQVTDANGLISQTVYDGLDRVLQQKEPDLTTSSTLVTVSEFTYTDTAGAVSVKRADYLNATSTTDTYTYYDGLSRPIQTRKEAEGSFYAVTDLSYNALGLAQKQSLPYFSDGTAKTAATTTASLFTTFAYDALRRVKTQANSVGTTTSAYTDWGVTVTDPNGKPKDLLNDAYGRLVEVNEHNATSTYVTQYQYNGNGNLTKITDALANVRNFTYDGLGRRITAQDLHGSTDGTYGTWTYTYDDTGNATAVVDPKSQTINYTYDDVNRVLTEDFTGTTGTEVTYAYDGCTFGIGSLCSTTSTGATTTNKFNPRKWVNREIKKIGSSTYITLFDFDRRGNQVAVTNPDSSKFGYVFNDAGLLERVNKKETTDASFVAVVTDINRAPTEAAASIAFANGVSTVNTHDPAKQYRLIKKVSTLPSASAVQDITYAYDAVGNITQLTDNSTTTTKRSIAYTYDDLNRLLSASATNTPSGISGYTQTYTYDAIGNLLSKSDLGLFTYANASTTGYANPHAVVSVSGSAIAYDNNGNTISIGGGSSSSSTSGWQVNGGTWQRKRTITIDKTKVSGGATLTNFPIVVNVADSEFRSVANGGGVASATGTDIFFTSADGTTKLSHELENYTSSTGSFTAWVKVPSVATSTDTMLYVYYGNASAPNQQNKTGVWDTNARGVWHLDNSFLDSTSNTNNGTNSGSTNVAGKIGSARGFNGSQRITVASSTSLEPTSQMTASFWFKSNGAQGDWTTILGYGQTASAPWGPYNFQFNGSSDTDTYFHLASTSTDHSTPANVSFATSTWYHIAGVYDGSNIKYYVNGAQQTSWGIGINIGNYGGPNGLGIGGAYQWGSPVNGSLDEVRIDNVARSDGWLATSYNNQNSTSTFLSFGGAQLNPGSGTTTPMTPLALMWDYQNRLTQAARPKVATSTYAYDSFNQRVSMTVAATSTVSTNYPSKFYNVTGTSRMKHLFLGDEMIATISGTGSTSTVQTILTDHLSGSGVITNASGTVIELTDYLPFGGVRLDQKNTSYNEQRKFTGHEYDPATDLNYMNARYQSGKLGRFLSQDPAFWNSNKALTDPQLLNSYAYARNNPLALIDPNGQWPSSSDVRRGAATFLNNTSNNVERYSSSLNPLVSPSLYVQEKIVQSTIKGTLQDAATLISPDSSGVDKAIAGVGLALIALPGPEVNPKAAIASKIEWGAMWTEGGGLSRMENLMKHARGHATDLGIFGAGNYQNSAKDFLVEGIQKGFEATVTSGRDSAVRVWDSATRRFGSYALQEGQLTPKTFMKASSPNYWMNQMTTRAGQVGYDLSKLIK